MEFLAIAAFVAGTIFVIIKKFTKRWDANNTPEAARTSTKKVLIAVGVALSIALTVGYAALVMQWKDYQHAQALKIGREKVIAEKDRLASDLRDNKETIVENIRKLLSTGKPDQARALASKYGFINDPQIAALIAESDAAIGARKKEVRLAALDASVKLIDENDSKAKIDAYKELVELAPSVSTYNEKLKYYVKQKADAVAKLAAAAAKEQLAEKAARKKRGVTIGMTKQEAIDSSWGKPEKVNRTLKRDLEHEQWVYGGGSYLYFDNGLLTAIQN